MKSVILYIAMGFFSAESMGAIFHWKLNIGADSPAKSIGEDDYKFKEGDWNCVVYGINKKVPLGTEIRSVNCEGPGGLSFGIGLGCGDPMPNSDSINFTLTSKKKWKMIILSCEK